MGKRLTAAIFNIIIVMVSLAAIVGYFIFPFFRMTSSITFTEEFSDYLYTQFENNYKQDGEGEEESDVDVKQIVHDLLEELKKEKSTLSFTLEFQTSDFINGLMTRDPSVISRIVEKAVDKAVDDLTETINKVMKPVAKAVIKGVATITIRQSLSESGENYAEVLVEIGIDDEYLDENIDKILDSLLADEATVETITDEVMGVIDDVYDKLKESKYAEELSGELTEDDKRQIREKVEDVLTNFSDENGNIDVESAIAKFLKEGGLDINKITEGEKEKEVETTASLERAPKLRKMITAYAEEGESAGETQGTESAESAESTESGGKSESEDPVEEIKAAIKNLIMNSVNENSTYIMYGIMGIGGLIVFTFLTWAYLIIKIVFKAFMKNPCIKLKLPMWLGWIPFEMFMLTPSLLVFALSKFDIFALFGATAPEGFAVIMGAVSVKFFSGGIVSFIAMIALFVIWLFYRPLRKSFKQQKKEQ
ncbi:MAG: hypothetical protein IJ706_10465 [Clostridia bacterium]|nr:hypothetical protein [Clostridia bacterium]